MTCDRTVNVKIRQDFGLHDTNKHEFNDLHSKDTLVDFVSDASMSSRDGGGGPQSNNWSFGVLKICACQKEQH
jgi:hypothetical protein